MSVDSAAGKDQSSGSSWVRTGVAGREGFRWIAADVTEVTRQAQQRLDLGPVASVAFGRCAAAAAMLLRLTSKAPRRLVLDVRGSGPLSRVLVEVGKGGGLRGLVGNPHADVRDVPESEGPLDVAAALGIGLLRLRREEHPKELDDAYGQGPVTYESQVELVSSEIGGDVAYFLQQSEQRKSAIAVGVEVGPDGIRSASGFLVEALPGASPEALMGLERAFLSVDPISRTLPKLGAVGLARGLLPEAKSLEKYPVEYRCRCSAGKLIGQLASLPPAEINSLSEHGVIKAECAFCGQVYDLSEDELLQLSSVPS